MKVIKYVRLSLKKFVYWNISLVNLIDSVKHCVHCEKAKFYTLWFFVLSYYILHLFDLEFYFFCEGKWNFCIFFCPKYQILSLKIYCFAHLVFNIMFYRVQYHSILWHLIVQHVTGRQRSQYVRDVWQILSLYVWPSMTGSHAGIEFTIIYNRWFILLQL